MFSCFVKELALSRLKNRTSDVMKRPVFILTIADLLLSVLPSAIILEYSSLSFFSPLQPYPLLFSALLS